MLKATDKQHHHNKDTVRFSHLFPLLSFNEWKALCQGLGVETHILEEFTVKYRKCSLSVHYLANIQILQVW